MRHPEIYTLIASAALAAILHCSIAVGSTWSPTSGPEGGRMTEHYAELDQVAAVRAMKQLG